MKKMLMTALIMMIFGVLFIAGAEEFGDYTVDIVWNEYCELIRYNGSEENVEIPASFNGVPLYHISTECFMNNDKVISITVPSGVTEIHNRVFFNCKNLKSVFLPSTVCCFGDEVFANCSNLETVVLPKNPYIFCDSMFDGCDKLVLSPEDIQFIEEEKEIRSSYDYYANAFNIAELKKYTGKGGDVIIPQYFYGFDEWSWPESEVVEQKLLYINDECFAYDEDITSVVIPEGVLSIGYKAFYGCKNLKKVVLPLSIRSIYDSAFAYCSSLEEIVLPDNVQFDYRGIGKNLFDGCSNLKLTEKQVFVFGSDYSEYMREQILSQAERNEIGVYLGGSFDDMKKQYPEMHHIGSDGLEHGYDGMSVYCENHAGIVTSVSTTNAKYSIYDIYPMMNLSDATKELLKKGWKIDDRGVYYIEFVNDEGCRMEIWSYDKEIIDSVEVKK